MRRRGARQERGGEIPALRVAGRSIGGGGLGGRRFGEAQLEEEDLSAAGQVAGFAEDAGRFLGGVEAHRVLGVDEIDAPRGLALRL